MAEANHQEVMVITTNDLPSHTAYGTAVRVREK